MGKRVSLKALSNENSLELDKSRSMIRSAEKPPSFFSRISSVSLPPKAVLACACSLYSTLIPSRTLRVFKWKTTNNRKFGSLVMGLFERSRMISFGRPWSRLISLEEVRLLLPIYNSMSAVSVSMPARDSM